MKYIAVVLAVIATAGCQTGTQRGALGGGAVGAAAGGIIGHQSGETAAGAAIGGALGALSGAVIAQDRQAKANNPGYLPLTNITEMARTGVADTVIIDEIKRTNSRYYLSAETITYLKNNQVSDRVINYMLETGR